MFYTFSLSFNTAIIFLTGLVFAFDNFLSQRSGDYHFECPIIANCES